VPLPPFTSPGLTDLEKDSDLAIFLLDYLERRRDAASGAWPGERETRRLQNTCHIVEGLAALDLGLISSRLIEPALKWLIGLPLLRDVLPQDRRIIRIYPMRFKTLAALDRFEDSRVLKDFAELYGYADRKTGWLADVPGDFSRVMNTMIWADTMLCLRAHDAPDRLWKPTLERALDALGTAFDKWVADGSPEYSPHTTELRGAREASYAFELLERGGRCAIDSAQGQMMESVLVSASRRQGRDEIRKTAYFGIQLATRFPFHENSRSAVADLLRAIRAHYESAAFSSQPDYFHALILRLLSAFYHDTLRDTIHETLWVRLRQTTVGDDDGLEQQRRTALTQLVHRHVAVNLGQVARLSGTRTRAAVYRVHFSLRSDATDRDGHPYSILPDSLQLIVKQGSIESLSRTIRRYGELPDDLRPYFARHSDMPETVGDEWYLTMEDLVGMSPLSEVLDRVDGRWAGRAEHELVARAAAATASALRALHQHRRRAPVASNELGWLYLTPISEAINALCEANAFPELKPYVENGFESNGCARQSLNAYLTRLQRHSPALTPPAISAVHGDCHSRNLMIDSGLGKLKFVDLETLAYNDDYLADYGLLIEDVALYRYLPRGQGPDCLTVDEIAVRASAVDYPRLPRGADSILFFERCLIEQLAAFAASVNDSNFKPRLWLAIVRNLIQLGARQLPAQLLDPQRRDESLKLTLVAYAEAARLLDELAAHLDGAPLPEMPFTAISNQRSALSPP